MDIPQDYIDDYHSDILSASITGFNGYLKNMTTFEERQNKTFNELWSDYLDALEIARQAQRERMK